MITFYCKCGQKIKVPEIHGGKKGKCPHCKQVIPIPRVSQESASNRSTPAIKEQSLDPPGGSARLTGVKEESGIKSESIGKAAKGLYPPVAWLKFYTYVRVPLGVILSFSTFRLIYPLIAEDKNVLLLVTSFTLVEMGVVISLFFGLHTRKLWGWRLNWIVLTCP